MTPSEKIIDKAIKQGRNTLTEVEGKALLSKFGITVPRSGVIRLGEDIESSLQELKPPLAVKVLSSEIMHKSETGGVRLSLMSATEVAKSIEEMSVLPDIKNKALDGFLVEEMVANPGKELVIGGLHDKQFGTMIMVGLGGIFVEILKDISFRLCPINRDDAHSMLEELKGKPILEGVRGESSVSIKSIVDLLLKFGGKDGLLMQNSGAISEFDLNPVIVSSDKAVAVDATAVLFRENKLQTDIPRDKNTSAVDIFGPLFKPKTIAVVGASTTTIIIANTFIRRMKAFGYPGEIYPIHPKASEVEGLPAYKSLGETPKKIDYAYIATRADRIPELIGAAKGNVKFAQVISSGFREVHEGIALEANLVTKAKEAGCRLIGPNCLGIYSPRGGVTFPVDAPKELGSVGVVTQSGGLGTDIIKRGQSRGLRFSGFVTVGNCADIGPADLLEFYLEDKVTSVIGFYLEDIGDGRRFFELLHNSKTAKPVIIMKGGRSELGRIAAASHTGALADNMAAWRALALQTPCALVETVDQFINSLLALQQLKPRPKRPTKRVVLFGNGGGTSVLATDFFAEQDLEVMPFELDTKEKLEALQLPPGTSVANPIDTPVRTLQLEEGRVADRILNIVYQSAKPDAVVMHLNLTAFIGRGDIDPIENLFQVAVNINTKFPNQTHFVLALRSDGSAEVDDRKRLYWDRALENGMPVFDELPDAAYALSTLSHIEQNLFKAGN
ncbi:MAG: acetate--CoA ligase family protein [Nitrospinota bacterium]|nr:acetate--CoA ligase family protein [Nitrospinota bacterium]